MARQAPKSSPDDDPAVVDLARYRQAQADQQKARRPPPPVGEPLLGSRPRAGLILGLMILVMLALWMLSSLA